MDFNIQKIIFGLRNPELFIKKPDGAEAGKVGGFAPEINSGLSNAKPQPNTQMQPTLQNLNTLTQVHHMNNFAQTDRSVYVKSLLGLPQTLGEILQAVQNPNKPLVGGTLGLAGLNQTLLQNQKVLSEIFQDMNPAAITQDINAMINPQPQVQAQARPDAIALMFSGMISMPDISKVILQNSKQAVAALIISMASASKNGMDGKQIQETLSVINSCIAMAESDNPAQNLKSLMMLYLPWLPLNDGVGFDLEVTPQTGENDSNDSKLTVLIQTKNFGNLKGVFTLTTSNSVEVYIICSDSFPKATLQKKLMEEGSSHAMNTSIDIEEVKPIREEQNEARETKVNLSATNEMNPYLLLMAHAFIRNTILIDNEGISSAMAADSDS